MIERNWMDEAAKEIVAQVANNSFVTIEKQGKDTVKFQAGIPQWLVYDIIEKHAPKKAAEAL